MEYEIKVASRMMAHVLDITRECHEKIHMEDADHLSIADLRRASSQKFLDGGKWGNSGGDDEEEFSSEVGVFFGRALNVKPREDLRGACGPRIECPSPGAPG